MNLFVPVSRRIKAGLIAALLMLSLSGCIPVSADADALKESEENAVLLPILMYHGILPDNSKGLGDYVVSVSEFESDLKYLRDQGYTAVGMDRVIAYVKEGKALPEKPVMITFDDGYYNNYLYAYPLVKQYSSHMVLSPICKWTDFYTEDGTVDARYTHVTWDQIREMTASKAVEIQNHSYDLHTCNKGRQGSARAHGESVPVYQELLRNDLSKAQERIGACIGEKPSTFTYPFGAVSKEAGEVLRSLGFEAALTCEEKVNRLTREEECLFRLGRFRRPHGVPGDAFLKRILP